MRYGAMVFIVTASLVGAAVVAFKRMRGALDRTGPEVAGILRRFAEGEPSGFLADDFIHVPISDPRLERIREQFEELADRHQEWEPQAPFPISGRQELERLIAEALALVAGHT